MIDLRGDYLTFVEGESEAEALRLDQRTELDRTYFEYSLTTDKHYETGKRIINVRDYGSGIIEVGYSANISIPSIPGEESDPEHRCKTLLEHTINLDRSLRRSKAQVRRKCMTGGLDYLLTLTYRTDYSEDSVFHTPQFSNKDTFAHLARFVRLVRSKLPDWKYVSVIEKHKNGANHLHLAVKGFQNVHLLRRMWRRVVGDGNIDVKAPKHSLRGLWNLAKLAGYISKYITKNANSGDGRQRYRVSEGLVIPEHITVIEFRLDDNEFLEEIFDSLGVDEFWDWNSGMGHGWACTW